MSMVSTDYRAEARAAAQMADTETSEVDRSDWLFVALAWQALARRQDAMGQTLRQDKPVPGGAGEAGAA
jgi:hypothetical protein